MQGQLKAIQVKGNKATVWIATSNGMYSSTIHRGYIDCSCYIGCTVDFEANGWIITRIMLAE